MKYLPIFGGNHRIWFRAEWFYTVSPKTAMTIGAVLLWILASLEEPALNK